MKHKNGADFKNKRSVPGAGSQRDNFTDLFFSENCKYGSEESAHRSNLTTKPIHRYVDLQLYTVNVVVVVVEFDAVEPVRGSRPARDEINT